MANAVLDGADGILLGAETLRGSYPVQTIQTVLSICRSAEAVFDHGLHFETLMSGALEVRHPACSCSPLHTRKPCMLCCNPKPSCCPALTVTQWLIGPTNACFGALALSTQAHTDACMTEASSLFAE